MAVGVGEGRSLAKTPTNLNRIAHAVAHPKAVQAARPTSMSCGVISIANSVACLATRVAAQAVDSRQRGEVVRPGVACKLALA